MKRTVALTLTSLLLVAGIALAQEAAPPAQPGQAGQDQGARQQRRVRPDRMGGAGQMDSLQFLNLTAEQQAKVNDIYQKVRQERREAGGGRSNPEEWQKMRQQQDELNKAAVAGDDAKVEQLQAEMQSGGMTAQMHQQQEQINDQIEQILTAEQRAKFREFRMLQASGLPMNLATNPDALQKAVMKLPNLADMQKNQFEAIFERYNREAASPGATEQSKQAAAMKVAADVVKDLKPSQKALLTSQNRGQMGRGNRANRPARDTGTAAPDSATPPASDAGATR